MAEAAVAPPAAPAAAQAAPTPAPTQTAQANSAIEDLFNIPADEPAPEAKPDDKAGEVKPVQAKKPDETPKLDDKPVTKPEGKTTPPKAASLREALDLSKQSEASLRKENEELKKKLATPAEDTEKKSLLEERTKWTKHREELETELKYAKYESTQEYKDKYETPFLNEYGRSQKRVAGLKINDADSTEPRAATAQDFDNLMGISGDGEAWEYAQKAFGDKAQIVWQMRERVQELNDARAKAIDDFRKEGIAREKQKSETTETETKQFQGLFDTEVKAATENPKLKHWFTADDGDVKGKELLDKGFSLADQAFGDTSTMAPGARARLYAAVRNRAGAAGLLAHKLQKLQAALDEATEKIKGYEGSEPNHDGEGGKGGGGATGKTGFASADEMIDRMAK